VDGRVSVQPARLPPAKVTAANPAATSPRHAIERKAAARNRSGSGNEGRLADHHEVRRVLEEALMALAHHCVIVDQQDAQLARRDGWIERRGILHIALRINPACGNNVPQAVELGR